MPGRRVSYFRSYSYVLHDASTQAPASRHTCCKFAKCSCSEYQNNADSIIKRKETKDELKVEKSVCTVGKEGRQHFSVRQNPYTIIMKRVYSILNISPYWHVCVRCRLVYKRKYVSSNEMGQVRHSFLHRICRLTGRREINKWETEKENGKT
jgi:hypothetical protein